MNDQTFVSELPNGVEELNRDLSSAKLATRGSRLAAILIDWLVGVVACLPGLLMLEAAPLSRSDEPVGAVLVLLLGLGGYLLVQWVLLAKDGQTIGKKAMQIRIVRSSDESNPGFGGAVVLRLWIPGLISVIPLVGLIFSLIDVLYIFGDDRRCLHDHLAGTKVVRV